jgi:hypothetical protein
VYTIRCSRGPTGIAKKASATVQDALASFDVGRDHHDNAAGKPSEVPTANRGRRSYRICIKMICV